MIEIISAAPRICSTLRRVGNDLYLYIVGDLLSALYIAWLQIMYGVCNTIFCSPFCISVVKVFRSIGSLFHAVQSPLKSATSFVWSVSVSQLIAVNCFVSLISVQRLARMAVAFLTLWFSASAWNARLVSSNHILSKYSNKVLADAVVKPPLYTTISRSMFWRDVPHSQGISRWCSAHP